MREKTACVTVGRGPVPRHRACTRAPTLAGDRPPRYDKKRLLGPKGPKTPLLTMELAGDRPPRYGNIETRGLSYRTRRNMKHPHLKSNAVLTDADCLVFSAVWIARL